MRQNILMMCAWVTLVLGVALEERLMETPMENTITDFELAEEGFSVVLTNALEDARELVEYLARQQDTRHREWFKANNEGREQMAEFWKDSHQKSAEIQFRAMRISGLLESMRDREAGQVT